MNTVEYLIKRLEELGITNFFGLPGDYNFNILNVIENNKNLHWIGCTNELNAGYAADGYARQKGYGALVTTYGVGELSAINAIAGSYAENVPVIHIVGAPSTDILKGANLYHHNFQNPEPQTFMEAFKNVTAATAFLSKDSIKIDIDRVLKVLVNEKKPVYIAIPQDVALMKVPDRIVFYERVSDTETLETVVRLIAEKINSAGNPVIIADTLIKRFDSVDPFREFVQKTGIPATNFLMGTGILNSDAENYLGTYLGKYGNNQAREFLEKSDCLISVGAIYGDTNSYGTSLPHKINSHIAIYGTYTYIEGKKYTDIKMSDVLREITKKVNHRNIKINPLEIGYKKSETNKEKLSSKYIYPRLQEFFRGEDIIFAECGTIPQGFAPIKLPENCEFHSQLLWCSIGWATPAAFGACIANPKARVILVTGDGAHQVSAMEIGNMNRYGVKPVIILINNSGYTIERALSIEDNHEYNDIMEIDYAKFARSFKGDIWATSVDTDDDFDKALRVSQIMDKLCYIVAEVEKTDMPRIANEYFGKIKSLKNEIAAELLNLKTGKSIDSIDENFTTSVHTSLKDYEE